MRILLIEDEDSIRGAMSLALTRDGHDVVAAANLAEGRRVAGEHHPVLLVSDLKLPDGSGLDLAEELGVPVVMLSGYATFDDAVRALRLGAVDFFTKPVAIKDVRAAVRRAAERGSAASGLPQTVWRTPLEARSAWERLQPALSGVGMRALAAECCQAVPSGRLVVDGHQLWLQPAGPVDPAARPWLDILADSLSWGPAGVLVRAAPEPQTGYDANSEILWPQEFGETIRADAWRSVGRWLFPRLNDPGCRVIGLDAALAERLARVGVIPHQAPADLGSTGVGAGEREGLFGPESDGPPIA